MVPTLTLGQAAKESGISKATLSKALKSGRLSYVAKSAAGYEIDPAELFRVFPRKQGQLPQSERLATPTETTELAVLRVRLEAAEQRATDLAKELDRAHEEKLRILALLPAPDHFLPPPRGFWSRLRGHQGK